MGLGVPDAQAAPEGRVIVAQGVNKRVVFQALSSEQIVGAWLSLRDGR